MNKRDTLPITLTVVNLKTGQTLQTKRLDFMKKEDRQNIAKTAWWAMHQGYELRTLPDTALVSKDVYLYRDAVKACGHSASEECGL